MIHCSGFIIMLCDGTHNVTCSETKLTVAKVGLIELKLFQTTSFKQCQNNKNMSDNYTNYLITEFLTNKFLDQFNGIPCRALPRTTTNLNLKLTFFLVEWLVHWFSQCCYFWGVGSIPGRANTENCFSIPSRVSVFMIPSLFFFHVV